MVEPTAMDRYKHWMLREIYEQPAILATTLEHYLADNDFNAEHCAPLRAWIEDSRGEIVIAASGSSRHAGMVAEHLIEDASGIAVDVEYASEYCYRETRALKRAAVMVISQSGETADTLAALRKANAAGQRTLAITNVPGSTMAREASVSFPCFAGRERAIPATKSFTAQLLNLYLISLIAAECTGTLSSAEKTLALANVRRLPSLIERQMHVWEDAAVAVAAYYEAAQSFLFLGRGVHYPIAREGALKLKESAYRYAEGYPSGELKHGPNALVGGGTVLIMIATVDRSDSGSVRRYGKVVQLMRDLHEQKAKLVAVANAGDETVAGFVTHLIPVEETSEALLSICEVIPLQMISYFMAVNSGIDVDAPRDLQKAVLTE